VAIEQDASSVREELARVLSSSGFIRNERLSRFLRFVVERHLDGRDEEIKESLIGVEVFGRKPDYDPKLDSVVRTEAARLRARLAEYYGREHREGRLVIELPKGGYLPVFHYPETVRRSMVPWLAIASVVAVTIIAAVFGLWRVQARLAPVRIAVLPLDDLGIDGADKYFVDGLTDELIGSLSVIEGIAVRSRTSSFAFKGKPHNLRDAAKQLDVDYILEGSVERALEHVRIRIQLIRVRDDLPLWSGRFDRALTDVLAIQDEISRGIVNSLRLQLGRGRRRYETSVGAYDLYLRGRALSGQDPPAKLQSIAFFERAIAKDPSFAPAYAALASMYANRSMQFVLDHPADEMSKMREAADKALELDPLLAEGHDALGMIYARAAQWEQAEKSFRRAIALDPNRSTTYDNLAMWLLFALGRKDEALRELRLAAKADPLSPVIQGHLAGVLLSVERYEEAERSCLKLPIGYADRKPCLARVRLGEGHIWEALQLLVDARHEFRNPQTDGFLGYAYAKAGRRREAEELAAASQYPHEQALIFAGLGDKDRTFEALDRIAVLGAQRVGRQLNFPELGGLIRDDPRLPALRHKVGLPQ
jgi:serine/threonine-protein kinase